MPPGISSVTPDLTRRLSGQRARETDHAEL
jgi:hypothetical protein